MAILLLAATRPSLANREAPRISGAGLEPFQGIASRAYAVVPAKERVKILEDAQ
jgi:hypothetical protein